jgi:hypothetical protein
MTANGDPAAPVVHPPRWSWYCADCGTRGEVQTWEGGDSFDAWTRVHEQHKDDRGRPSAARRPFPP